MDYEADIISLAKIMIDSKEKYKELESPDYFSNHVSQNKFNILNLLNISLMEVLWDPLTEKELEKFFKKKLDIYHSNIISVRINYDTGEPSSYWPSTECIYGWIHYKDENIIQTLKFVISLDGYLKKC